MADLGLASPNEKRDGNYTVKVLPGGVNLTDHVFLNFGALPECQRKTHDGPGVERSHRLRVEEVQFQCGH